MIERATIEEFFRAVSESRHVDINKPQLWGFFFLDSDISKLKKLGDYLQEDGYTFVDIFEAESVSESQEIEYYLHVEKEEIHDVDSLIIRSSNLSEIIDKMGVKSYDGFDVG